MGIRRIAVAAGGTAGHIVAGLEFLKAYRSEFGAEGLLIGCNGPLEERLAAARGDRIEHVPGLPFALQNWRGKAAAAAAIGRGVRAARQVLRREGIQLVIGTGGFGSFNPCLAARSMRLPLVIHEANASPGIANRVLARAADRVCVGFESAASLGGGQAVVTGNPGIAVRRQARVAGQPARILVTGGSLGSPMLNREAPELFAVLRGQGLGFSVHHIAGLGNREAVEREYAARSIAARVEEFAERMEEAYATADFAITAAGALTIADLAAGGVPALLVPHAGVAHGHQAGNAREYAAQSGALWVEESRWHREVQAGWISAILGDEQRWEELSRKAMACSRPDAARDVVRVCEELLIQAA